MIRRSFSLYLKSHPTWVRGLKQNVPVDQVDGLWSHPTWVRGLKRSSLSPGFAYLGVAPYVGAWIETEDAL